MTTFSDTVGMIVAHQFLPHSQLALFSLCCYEGDATVEDLIGLTLFKYLQERRPSMEFVSCVSHVHACSVC